MIDFTNGSIFKLTKGEIEMDVIQQILVQDEKVIGTYKAVRDYVAFTTKRIICVNVKGIVGKKKDFSSLPYSKVQAFSIETAGAVDLDTELELYFAGLGKVHFDFERGADIFLIGKTIGQYIL